MKDISKKDNGIICLNVDLKQVGEISNDKAAPLMNRNYEVPKTPKIVTIDYLMRAAKAAETKSRQSKVKSKSKSSKAKPKSKIQEGLSGESLELHRERIRVVADKERMETR